MATKLFHPLSLEQFRQLLAQYPDQLRRRINGVHLHHTWRPNHAQYRGEETIRGMWRVHTQENGWADIAQHLTIAPDGAIWTGRDWDLPPASAKGFNGSVAVGPFMIEMIGDFDLGRDRFEGAQKEATVEVLALLHERFELDDRSLRFHNMMSGKTCPGSAIHYENLLQEIRDKRAGLERAAPEQGRGLRPFSDGALRARQVIEDLKQPTGALSRDAGAFADGELAESEGSVFDWSRGAPEGERGPQLEITPELLVELKPYVINLTQGRFSQDGELKTTTGDVDAIFDQHLPRELTVAEAASRPLRIVFYLHGGLGNEAHGIGIAHKHVAWWLANGVYPIYFAWETGLGETIGALLRERWQKVTGDRGRGARVPVLNRVIEHLIHGPGEKVWSGMKHSAERAVDDPVRTGAEGGAFYVAQCLARFCGAHASAVEVHAVGHSAGSNFHGFFVPTLLDAGVPALRSTHFMAPAITVESFKHQLLPLLEHQQGSKLGPLTLYTMHEPYERKDDCAKIYGRSLLYLIHYALERERATPLLGLEESLRDDATLRRVFGLDGSVSPRGEVVWSRSSSESGRSASRAVAHGQFDDDVATMDSVLRRVLGKGDTDGIRSYALYKENEDRGVADLWQESSELPPEVADWLALAAPAGNGSNGSLSGPSPVPPAAPGPVFPGGAARGRRRALSIGIDTYPSAPLNGCVADARRWAGTLTRLGFEPPTVVINEEATRSRILSELEKLMAGSQPGDVLAFQYAGHGTEVTDFNGDEATGLDQAFCAYDFEQGHLVIDDDLAEAFARLPEGVNLTCFLDCCHSGTGTRLAAGGRAPRPTDPPRRARYIVASPDVQAAHAEFRRRTRGGGTTRTRYLAAMKEVTFSACQSWEVAWESQGQGDFTRRATEILDQGIEGLTHDAFQQRVIAAFGAAPRQQPLLDCAPAARALGLLERR